MHGVELDGTMTENLFSKSESAAATPAAPGGTPNAAPLATRMRPRTLEDFVGQRHILAPGKLLWRAITADRISSIILYGPPGTGKTSLAQVIANATKTKFERLSGVESNVADIRRVIATAANRLANAGQKTILFIDEIHRFNKAQQDVLLPDVENGTVRLIGATTHNPFFYVNSPLVSRSQIFELKPLTPEEILMLLRRGLTELGATADADALAFLAVACDGDARKALNSLEIAVLTSDHVGARPAELPEDSDRNVAPTICITKAVAEESIQKKAVVYDGDGDEHYDTISAFIKSMRGSDPDAALYWLAKMVVAGEDPRFIARRIAILAAEDVGLADPQALVLAVAAHHAVEFIGWPEGELPLAEATVYCATAPKSNASAKGIWSAKADVEAGRTLPVPAHLKDTHYKGAARLGHGQDYKYAHDFEGHLVAQDYLTEKRTYYTPSDQGFELKVRERMAKWQALLQKR
jgi:putative ATPase